MYGIRGLGAEAMGPPVDPNTPVTPPDVQQQIADLWDSIFSMGELGAGSGGVMTPAPAPSAGAWLNANAGKVAIGAAAFLGLVMVAKKGR